MVHVYILSPSPAIRLGLRALLESTQSIQVSGEAADTGEIGEVLVDVLIYAPGYGEDISLESLPEQVIEGRALLFLTEEVEAVRRIIEQPRVAWGILSPNVTGDELVTAIHALYEGFILLDGVAAKKLIQFSTADTIEANEVDRQPLTERETEVLQLIAEGLANKQIALQLNVSPHTVKFHISSIYNKLGATNRTEAVRIGLRKGLVIL